MNGQRVGYVRVSTLDQNTGRQVEQLKGEHLDRIFEDKVSGKSLDRPQLDAMLRHVRAGDTIVVTSMDRLARNLGDLRRLVDDLTAKGVAVQFLKENLTFTNEATSIARLMLSIMGAVSEFERSILLDRQREGIAVAKQAGKYRGGKAKLTPEKVADLRKRVAAGEKKAVVARDFGISRETLYTYLEAA